MKTNRVLLNITNAFQTLVPIVGMTIWSSLCTAQTSQPAKAIPLSIYEAIQKQDISKDSNFLKKQIAVDVLKKFDIGREASPVEQEILKLKKTSGGGDTGGGSVVACYDSQKKLKSLQVYDLYEAEKRYGLKADFENAQTTEEALSVFLFRLFLLDPATAIQLGEGINLMAADSILLEESNPPAAHDLHPIVVPSAESGCQIESTILQKSIQFDEEKQFYVNAKIWNALSPTQKAAMIIHEVLWSRARTSTQQDSTAVRYVHAKLWANGYKNLNFQDYLSKVAPMIQGEGSFFMKGLLVNHFGKVYQGTLKTNLGIVSPLQMGKVGVRKESFAYPLRMTIKETRLCQNQMCVENIKAIDVDQDNRVVNIYSQSTKDLMIMTMLNRNSNPEVQITVSEFGGLLSASLNRSQWSKEGLQKSSLRFLPLALKKILNYESTESLFGIYNDFDRIQMAEEIQFRASPGSPGSEIAQVCVVTQKQDQFARVAVWRTDDYKFLSIYDINDSGILSSKRILRDDKEICAEEHFR